MFFWKKEKERKTMKGEKRNFPVSNASLAIGENSILNVKIPSLGRSSAGVTTFIVMTAKALLG